MINKGKISSLAALKRVDGEVGAQRTLRHRGILQVRAVRAVRLCAVLYLLEGYVVRSAGMLVSCLWLDAL